MKYYINNCFFVRVTNESIEKRDMLEKMYKGEISINDFIEMNPQFLEALMNSNYLLYQLIKDNQVSENQKKTIARYFQRSIIRTYSSMGYLRGLQLEILVNIQIFVEKVLHIK